MDTNHARCGCGEWPALDSFEIDERFGEPTLVFHRVYCRCGMRTCDKATPEQAWATWDRAFSVQACSKPFPPVVEDALTNYRRKP